MITSWTIEYWNEERRKVECFSSQNGSWEDAPRHGVIYIYVFHRMKRPFGNPDREYMTGFNGKDIYALQDNRFAWFNPKKIIDPPERKTGKGGGFHTFDGNVVIEKFIDLPEWLDPKMFKYGIWVEEPYAKRLGFGPNAYRFRTIKGCI